MAERIHLESPETDLIESPEMQIMGWCLSDDVETPLTMHIGRRLVEYSVMERPDVQRVFPGAQSRGFSYWLTTEDLVAAGGKLELRIVLGATTLAKTFRCSEAAIAHARDWVNKKAAKRAWCLSAMLCPTCRAGRPVVEASGLLRCPSCNAELEQTTSALNLLPAELYRRFHLKPTGKISSHPYPPEATELIESARRAGGKVLDCGAGSRSIQDETVVNLEIVDYSSTDVLAVGQSLPFADGSFDAALSLAVLEHVDDPFACAAEIARVVKPGGKIFCVVPFMQHEHGYPNHFFNMTRQGIVKVFEGKARVLSHTVPSYGAPIHTLCAYVDEYASSLPPAARQEFQKLTVRELQVLTKDQYWRKSYVTKLSAEGNWKLASVTAALFERNDAKIERRNGAVDHKAENAPALLLLEVQRKLSKLRRNPAAFFGDSKLKPLRRLKALFQG